MEARGYLTSGGHRSNWGRDDGRGDWSLPPAVPVLGVLDFIDGAWAYQDVWESWET